MTDYWILRLKEDRLSIVRGGPPKTILEPPEAPGATAAYRAITDKLANAAREHASKEGQIDAIDYWMARLDEDRSCLKAGVPFVSYPD